MPYLTTAQRIPVWAMAPDRLAVDLDHDRIANAFAPLLLEYDLGFLLVPSLYERHQRLIASPV
ncbi:MAG: hypothetical protein GX316_11475 [Firmicutes bacterium]|nr:hypothetical protein [Bacillota bacterium]